MLPRTSVLVPILSFVNPGGDKWSPVSLELGREVPCCFSSPVKPLLRLALRTILEVTPYEVKLTEKLGRLGWVEPGLGALLRATVIPAKVTAHAGLLGTKEFSATQDYRC